MTLDKGLDGCRILEVARGCSHKFTGQERDGESGSDNFGARYFGSSMGRFLSPDPSGIFLGNLGDPQQLNLYAYVRNNPINNIDPDGLDCTFLNSASGAIQDTNASENAEECSWDGGFWTTGPVNQVSQSITGGYQFGWSGTPSDPNLPPGTLGSITYKNYIAPTSHSFGQSLSDSLGGLFNAITGRQSTTPGQIQAKVFFQGLGQNFQREMDSGCVAVFGDAFNAGGFLPDTSPGQGVDDGIRQAGANVAFAYAATKALTVPLRSSIYRGILEGAGTVATGIAAVDFFSKAVEGAWAEGRAIRNGTCH